jgi:hypothetical protein
VSFLFGAIVGLLLGLIIAYWGQIKKVYQNKDKIGAISDASSALDELRAAFKF